MHIAFPEQRRGLGKYVLLCGYLSYHVYIISTAEIYAGLKTIDTVFALVSRPVTCIAYLKQVWFFTPNL
jgi:hypothetical protein